MCSIGGNTATNAGGLCCVKYGVTTDYVLGMQVVLADGTAVRLGGPRLKDVAGLSLTKLFVGSEGTLGVITEITLRLIPAQPAQTTVVATFSSLQSSADAMLAITRALRPSMLEFMDRTAINAVEDAMKMGLDRDAAAMLIARSDAPGPYAAAEAETMAQACHDAGAVEVFHTDDPDEGEAFCAARRFAIPAVERMGDLLLEDVGVPLPQLPALVSGIADIAAHREVTVVGDRARRGRQHPSADRLRPHRRGDDRTSAHRVRRDHGPRDRTRRHDHRRARRRPAQEGVAARLSRTRRDRTDPQDQERPRPAGHPQSRHIL